MADFYTYHTSLAAELEAVKNRVRNLVTHWPTDGEWKEAALRTVLRRHLPEGVHVGRGFIVGRDEGSTQIDLLVLKPGKPTLFRDGELVVVTPDVPVAITEVKTALEGGNAWYRAAHTLAQNGKICRTIAQNNPWLGLFSYEGDQAQGENILDAVCRVHAETGIPINCVSCGHGIFVRYWPVGEHEPGDDVADINRAYWRTYNLINLATSYFLSNLIDSVCNLDRAQTDYVWFAHSSGKRPHRISERRVEECRAASKNKSALRRATKS